MKSVSNSGEIVEDSSLVFPAPWPQEEPALNAEPFMVRTRLSRSDLLMACSKSRHFPSPEWKERNHPDSVGQLQATINLLNHRMIQFNSKNALKNCETIRNRIQHVIGRGGRLEILLPVFCVISNWQKRHHSTSLTFAEEVSLLHLANYARLFSEFIGIELCFLIISDATFYAPIFDDPMPAARQYVHDLQNFTIRHLISSQVKVLDLSDVIAGCRDYDASYQRNIEILKRDPLKGISREEFSRWTSSVTSTVNLDNFGLCYKDRIKLFHIGDQDDTKFRRTLALGENAFLQYRAMKMSLSEIAWEQRFFPDALRGTIHHKTTPVIGVRVYPEYKKSSKLLPYHGIAVVRHKHGNWKLTIEPEIYQHAKGNLPFLNRDKKSDFYVAEDSLSALLTYPPYE